MLVGVPQSSILGRSLFNTFPANLFFILNNLDIKNHVDDTPVSNTIDDLIYICLNGFTIMTWKAISISDAYS